jgi:hypothetical protein
VKVFSCSEKGSVVDLTRLLPPNAVGLFEELLVLPWVTDLEIVVSGKWFGLVVYHAYPEGVDIESQVKWIVAAALVEGFELRLEVVRGREDHRRQLRREIEIGRRGGQEYLRRTHLDLRSKAQRASDEFRRQLPKSWRE